jgi:uncharacterized protein YabN with tetrapyrrole methylase and pyrophosphatase domain
MTLPTGSLTLVGTGLRISGHVTQEALAAIVEADKLFHLVQDLVTHRWLAELNPTAESLYDSYREARPRREIYEEIVERMLAPVRRGKRVCAALYGHPGVFAMPAHEAIRRARCEGYDAEMLPGVSAEDCLIADLGFDPGARGCQSFEATDFLIRHRRFDPTSALVLWQIGGIGVADFRRESYWNPRGVGILAATLAHTYGADHEVVVYEASPYPVVDATIHRCPLSALAAAPISIGSTLLVPPLAERPRDEALLAELRGSTPRARARPVQRRSPGKAGARR